MSNFYYHPVTLFFPCPFHKEAVLQRVELGTVLGTQPQAGLPVRSAIHSYPSIKNYSLPRMDKALY